MSIFPSDILLLLAAYLLGSIPSGLVLTRLFSTADIRRKGSGNIGATNVARVAGYGLGIVTLTADMLKGLLPVLLVHACRRGPETTTVLLLAAVALAAVIGHMYPVYTRLRGGGKGVATTAGAFLGISCGAVLIALAVFGVVLWRNRRVSVASLAAAGSLPPALWLLTRSSTFLIAAIMAAALVAFRHRDNLARLLAGTEPEFKFRRDSRR